MIYRKEDYQNKMKKKTSQEERINTDALVIGAGTGSMMAAISAAAAGFDQRDAVGAQRARLR